MTRGIVAINESEGLPQNDMRIEVMAGYAMSPETIAGKDFFGRAQESQLLKERLAAFKSGFRQNIAVLGRPHIGKTSLVKNFLTHIHDEQVMPVYVEARDEDFSFFADRFIGSLLYNYSITKGVDSHKDDIKFLIANSKKALPRIVESIEKIYTYLGKKDIQKAYDCLLDLPQLAGSDAHLKCALIIEGFDKLINYGLARAFSDLGRKIMAQRDTLFVLTSSSAIKARHILNEQLQLLFGNFQIIELDEFDFTTARDYLEEKFSSFGIPDRHARFLINFTDGHPFYLNTFAGALCDALIQKKQRNVTTALVLDTLVNTLFNSTGQLHQHFKDIIYRYKNKHNDAGVSVLVALSEANHKAPYLMNLLGRRANDVSNAIAHLEDTGIVERVGVFNRIRDLPLRFWLKSVYYKEREDFTLDVSHRHKFFIFSVNKFYSDVIKSTRQDLYGYIVDLFRMFKGDMVKIGQKGHLLPAFGDVCIRVIGENGPYITGHSKGKNWICQIHKRKTQEKHIIDFLKDTKAGKYKFNSKVLITLNGMEDNARLLAKDSGIWAWNLKTLNLLLDVYGKQKVVVY